VGLKSMRLITCCLIKRNLLRKGSFEAGCRIVVSILMSKMLSSEEKTISQTERVANRS